MNRWWLAIALVCTGGASWAQTPAAAPVEVRYRVDLILFLDKNSGESPGKPLAPRGDGVLEADDAAALASAGIERLPAADFALADELRKLKLSKRYQPLLTLAWTQKNPPAERGPALRLHWGGPSANADTEVVDGSVALLMGRYLHLDADLGWQGARADGTPGSVHLKERRRMKRDELHYLDSPKLGLIAKVSKLKTETR